MWKCKKKKTSKMKQSSIKPFSVTFLVDGQIICHLENVYQKL
jgi:hypothetical protein